MWFYKKGHREKLYWVGMGVGRDSLFSCQDGGQHSSQIAVTLTDCLDCLSHRRVWTQVAISNGI